MPERRKQRRRARRARSPSSSSIATSTSAYLDEAAALRPCVKASIVPGISAHPRDFHAGRAVPPERCRLPAMPRLAAEALRRPRATTPTRVELDGGEQSPSSRSTRLREYAASTQFPLLHPEPGRTRLTRSATRSACGRRPAAGGIGVEVAVPRTLPQTQRRRRAGRSRRIGLR
jgi:hypothetical protein